MRDRSGPDHRRFPRLPVSLEVRFRGAADLQAAIIDSLSEGGVFIRTSRPLPIGTSLELEISLEDQSLPPARVRGRVAWVRQRAEHDGMGVAFVEPPPASLRKILTQVGA